MNYLGEKTGGTIETDEVVGTALDGTQKDDDSNARNQADDLDDQNVNQTDDLDVTVSSRICNKYSFHLRLTFINYLLS